MENENVSLKTESFTEFHLFVLAIIIFEFQKYIVDIAHTQIIQMAADLCVRGRKRDEESMNY